MLRALKNIPAYMYLTVGAIGATASYLLYPAVSKNRRKHSSANGADGFPRGLINYRNECFINVILQSLAASNKFTQWLASSERALVAASSTPTRVFNTLLSIMCGINRVKPEDGSQLGQLDLDDEDQCEFYAAQSLKRALNAHNWHIQPEEHDCHELFHLIMDVLDEEQKEDKQSRKSLNCFYPSKLKENSRNFVGNPFHGYLAIQFQCLDCEYKVN